MKNTYQKNADDMGKNMTYKSDIGCSLFQIRHVIISELSTVSRIQTNLCMNEFDLGKCLFFAVVIFPNHSALIPCEVAGLAGGLDDLLRGSSRHLCGCRPQVWPNHFRLHGC